jgi:hypothetical protein
MDEAGSGGVAGAAGGGGGGVGRSKCLHPTLRFAKDGDPAVGMVGE